MSSKFVSLDFRPFRLALGVSAVERRGFYQKVRGRSSKFFRLDCCPLGLALDVAAVERRGFYVKARGRSSKKFLARASCLEEVHEAPASVTTLVGWGNTVSGVAPPRWSASFRPPRWQR